MTVTELLARFWRHAQDHYRRADGSPTSEINTLKQAVRPLRSLFGLTPAQGFGPRALELVRGEMVMLGWCRSYVNKHIGRVRVVFRWGVAEQLLPPDQHQTIKTTPAVMAGIANHAWTMVEFVELLEKGPRLTGGSPTTSPPLRSRREKRELTARGGRIAQDAVAYLP